MSICDTIVLLRNISRKAIDMNKEKSVAQDMTEGPILSKLIYFMIPVFFGNIVQQIYGLTNSIIVGQCLGNTGLAAIGATDSLTYMVLGCSNGIAGGFAICTAQAFGSGNKEKLRKFTAQIVKYSLIISVSLSIFMVIFNAGILKLMGTPSDIRGYSTDYLTILYIGIPVSMGFNGLLSVLRSIGDSKIGLFLLAISSVINLLLDLLFVVELDFGVRGAATATVLAQLVSFIICLVYTYKKHSDLRFKLSDMKRDLTYLKALLNNGIPMGFQVWITSVATMIIQIALNKCGTSAITAFTIGTKIQNILTQSFNALGITIATFVGQNYGKGDFSRIRKGVKTGILVGFACSFICIVLTIIFLDPAIGLFGKEVTPKIVKYTHMFMYACLVGYFPLSLLFVFRNTLQGLGYGSVTLLGGASELLARFLVVAVLASSMGYSGIIWGHTAAWTMALIPLIPFYIYKAKRFNIN